MYSIDTNARLKLITVAFSGVVDVAQRSSAWGEVAETIKSIGNCRILLDLTAATVAVDDFQVSQAFAHRLTDFGITESRRVAYLCPHGARVNMVVEALADARGLTIERFNDREKALRWLLSDKPDQAPQVIPQVRVPRGA